MLVDESILKEHVYASNKFEGIIAKPGDPLYDSHLEAARIASTGNIVHPHELHKALAHNVQGLHESGGIYRDCEVVVGEGNLTPRSECVPSLMRDWFLLIEQYKNYGENIEYAAYFLHIWFLCIHPYVDGNGRVARLIWNMLRINKGFSWHVPNPAPPEVHIYNTGISRIEKGVFRKDFPDVYP